MWISDKSAFRIPFTINIIKGNYIQSYSITLVKRCKDLLLSNLFITFAL